MLNEVAHLARVSAPLILLAYGQCGYIYFERECIA
jgi:hypothetical protein